MRMNSPHRGFTIVETLVAIAVLMIIVVTPYYAADRALVASETARDTLLGNMLAQQAIENVRSVRDGNFLQSYHGGSQVDWMTGLDTSPNCFYPNKCTVENSPLNNGAVTVQQCGSSCTPMTVGSASNSQFPYYYSQTGSAGSPTTFVRSVQLYCGSKTANQSGCNPSASQEIEVVSIVQWTSYAQAAKTYSVEVDDFLDNWLPT